MYLDHAGSALYAASQVTAHASVLLGGVFGNPHSQWDSGRAMQRTRERVLAFFGTSEEHHSLIFTVGCVPWRRPCAASVRAVASWCPVPCCAHLHYRDGYMHVVTGKRNGSHPSGWRHVPVGVGRRAAVPHAQPHELRGAARDRCSPRRRCDVRGPAAAWHRSCRRRCRVEPVRRRQLPHRARRTAAAQSQPRLWCRRCLAVAHRCCRCILRTRWCRQWRQRVPICVPRGVQLQWSSVRRRRRACRPRRRRLGPPLVRAARRCEACSQCAAEPVDTPR